MDIKKEIEGIAQFYLNTFKDKSSFEYRKNIFSEHELKNQYRDRELFELLQNIEDALKAARGGKNGVASFELTGDLLIVSNNGKPFSIESVSRLCSGEASEKTKEFIGNKGIGFRSVLNWTDEIEIYSGKGEKYISVGFSKNYAKSKYLELINTSPEVKSRILRQHKELKGIKDLYPVFNAPQFIEPIPKKYDTVIKFHIKSEEVKERIKRDMLDFDKNVILFLDHVSEIQFSIEGEGGFSRVISKEINEDGIVAVWADNDKEEFYFNATETRLEEKVEASDSDIVKMAVAIPIKFREGRNFKLYTFFPLLDIESPFESLLHATFFVTPNRNDFESSSEEYKKANREVLAKLFNFYIDSVIKFIVGSDRLKFLCPVAIEGHGTTYFGFPWRINERFDFDRYKDLLSDREILKSRNGFLTPTDKSLMLQEKVPYWFDGKNFENLVAGFDSSRLYQFALKIAGPEHNYEKLLLSAINASVGRWSDEERINTFQWWNDKTSFTELPRILRAASSPGHETEEFIKDKSLEVFLSNSVAEVPSWANVLLLDKTDQDLLIDAYQPAIKDSNDKRKENNQTAERDIRILPRLIRKNLINLQEQSSTFRLVNPINNSVESYEEACEFLVWLFNNPPEDEDSEEFKKNVGKLRLPMKSRFGSGFKTPDLLYIDDNELNPVGSMVMKHQSSLLPVDYSPLSAITDSNKINSFLTSLGITKFPKPVVINQRNQLYTNLPLIFQDYIKYVDYKSDNFRRDNYYEIQVENIPQLREILEKLSTEQILRWIFADDRLKEILRNNTEGDNSYIYLRTPRGRFLNNFLSDKKYPSFIRFVFATTRWIRIGENVYSPSEILMSGKRFEILNELDIPWISEKMIKKLSQDLNKDSEEIRSIFRWIGVKERFIEFNSSEFYSLLLKISNLKNPELIKRSMDISRAIYREIIDNGSSPDRIEAFYDDCEEKTNFFNQGKVLAVSSSDIESYQPLEKVRFSSSATLPLKNIYFIKVDTRGGRKNDFKDILNIKSPEKDPPVKEYHKSLFNQEFLSDFKDFFSYFLAIYDGSLVKRLISLEVELADKILFDEKEDPNLEIDLKDYEPVIRKSGSWLILVPSSFKYSEIPREALASAITKILKVEMNFPARELLATAELLFVFTISQRQKWGKDHIANIHDVEYYLKQLRDKDEIKENVVNWLKGKSVQEHWWKFSYNLEWGATEDISTLEKIILLVKETGIDVKELERVADREISFSPLNLKLISEKIDSSRRDYDQTVYDFLIKNPSRREYFIDYKRDFDADVVKKDYDIRNDMNINLDHMLEDFLIKKGIDKIYIGPRRDYDKIYRANKKKIMAILDIDAMKVFISDEKNESLLYFEDELQGLISKAKAYKETIQKEEEEEKKSDVAEEINIEKIYENAVAGGILQSSQPGVRHHGSGGSVSERAKGRENRHKNERGRIAEELAVRYILEGKVPFIEDFFPSGYKVIPVSGNLRVSKFDGLDVEDTSSRGDDFGCDLILSSPDNKRKIYIEVKSSITNRCKFPLTQNEYELMEQIGKDEKKGAPSLYRVIFVSGLDIERNGEGAGIHFLEDPLYSSSFKKENTEYRFHYQK